MNAKEWFEQSGYEYKLEEHDEGGYLGIDENKVAEMLEEYHQYKLKLLGITDVVGQSEELQGFFEFYKQKFGGGFNTDVLEITLKQYQETL